MKHNGTLLIACLAACLAGCNSPMGWAWGQRLPGPRYTEGRTSEFQRDHAERFDPFPQDDFGMPGVDSRPREFQNPRPEVSRARN